MTVTAADEPLYPQFVLGTHRVATLEQTMDRLQPLLEALGVTRVAEIAGLDRDLGVPTYTAIRPRGLVLQTSNGKGLTPLAAKISGIMEAAEYHHAENPDLGRFVQASASEMRRRELVIPPRDAADRRFHHSPEQVIDWIAGTDLASGRECWVPASAAFFIEPTIYQTSTNGLGSGNHRVEAILHGLYELIERDAVSRLVAEGNMAIRGTCRILELSTVADEHLQRIFAKIESAGSQLVLMWVPAQAPVHVFWAVLLNHRPHVASTAFTTGFGAHSDMHIAAARAVSEAVQSRLTLAQSARDDIIEYPSFLKQELEPGAAARFFIDLESEADWSELLHGKMRDFARTDLRAHLSQLVESLIELGHRTIVAVDLSLPRLGLPVVKIIVPTLQFRRELF